MNYDVKIADQTLQVTDTTAVSDVLGQALSKNLINKLLAVKALSPKGAVLLDLSANLEQSLKDGLTELVPIYTDSQEGLDLLRHSTAHVMATAVKRLFPNVKVCIGPSITDGFYYDFDTEKPFSSEDFEKIEAEMQQIAKEKLPFTRSVMSKAEALEKFKAMGENYKAEIISELDVDTVSLYTCGEFTDLCRGPHIPHTGFTQFSKILSVAGAYWRGDEHKAMLSRLYGTAFASKQELKDWLKLREEAKKRDHRKLGKELDLFTFHEEVAPGMVFWLPKGMLIRTILEDFWRREHLKRGYLPVQGPQLLRVETWQQSGHYDHYRQNMYFSQIDEDQYGIKPMNCISHMLIFKHDIRSYRDLPQRYFELGVVHRHEKSGVLHGLLRVRQFTQDDAHILCTEEQLEGEILSVIGLIRDLMQLFDFQFKVAISTRPESSIGSDAAWEVATNALIGAVTKAGLEYELHEGDGAFYGPKIDVCLLDCLGRQWQCSTIQVDFTLPDRFDLNYTGSDGQKHRPVMVHRAIMGSIERFIGVLIEHYAGAMPTWLAPEQARILTVVDSCDQLANEFCETLKQNGIRATADTRNEKLGFKVREAQVNKVPWILVIGEQELQSRTVNVRLRNGENRGSLSIEQVMEAIREDACKPFRQGGMSYSFS